MSDIVERLRAKISRDEFFKVADALCREAAAEIDRLRAERDEAWNAAIEEAAKVAENHAGTMESLGRGHIENSNSRDRCFSRARSAFIILNAIRSLVGERCPAGACKGVLGNRQVGKCSLCKLALIAAERLMNDAS